ncbi:MAG: hypothetical protein MUC67_13120 [Acidobacteria bacterium]|nr:hypothetical protein [Acidobacteriota bacterium]
MTERFPTEAAWKKHTRGADRHGLSAGALACLGTRPQAAPDASSFTGYMGRVDCLTRDEAVYAGVLAAQAVGRGRGVVAKRGPLGWVLYAPVSAKAARELAHPQRVPCEPSVAGVRTAAYDQIMRPTARARIWANSILAEK